MPAPSDDPARTGDTQRAARSEASWRSLVPPARTSGAVELALGVELRQRVASASQWAPPRVETVTPRALAFRQDGLRVGLRPLVRGATKQGWVKGEVSWDALRRPGGPFDPERARWFAELHSIAREVRTLGKWPDAAEWLTLDTVESTLLWAHLESAESRGIPIVSTKKSHGVALARAAEITIEITPDPLGGLRVAARTWIDGVSIPDGSVRTIGRTGIYAFTTDRPRIDLTLAPVAVTEPVFALLGAGAPLVVPAAEVDEFLRDAYPMLQRRDRVTAAGALVLPPPTPPALRVDVAFGASHRIGFRLTWEYPGAAPAEYAAPTGTDPDRDPEFESGMRERVERAWSAASSLPFDAAGTLHDVDAAEFATHVLPALEQIPSVRVVTTGTSHRYHELTGTPEITISTVETTDPDWFELGVTVTIDGRRIPFTPLFTALTLRRKKILLSDGRYFSLAHPALDRLRELIDEAAEVAEWEAGPRISRYQIDLWADFEDLADQSEPAVSWRATAEALRDASGIDPTPAPGGLTGALRPYQQAGLDWLAFLWRHRLGGILADDMGLGKTIQMLALVLHAREAGERRPFLVVAPTSVLSTWQREAERFAPGLRVRTIDATSAKRGDALVDAAASADLIVTSYTLLRLDEPEFAAVEWAGLILDEAQFVKNPATKLHRAARDLRRDVTFAITGTPLENSLTDLWALLSLSAPGLFPSARRFREEYVRPIERGKVPESQEGAPERAARLERLRRRIRPLVLRRTKEAVAPELPPRQEQELHIELSPAHRAVYDTVLQRERQKVLGLLDDLDRNRFIVFRSLTLLRMLSLAPSLVDADPGGAGRPSIPSSKLDALLEHLGEIVAEGHRALIFSQFTSFLDIAARRLDAAGIAYVSLDGSTRRRSEVIDAFRGGAAPVFLISLKAGGFGLTLTEADYVFLLDPWWNPAAEQQAIDRAHRIGQTRSVMVYRMIAAGTIEEKVMALQRRKARLFTAVMDDDALFGQALEADDIRGLFED